MKERSSSADNYALGRTPRAIQRLLLLGQICRPLTHRVFTEAGITTGMKVLDVGCGPGDVSLIAADMVGETGQVLGIDASTDMLQVAQSRVQAAGLGHVYLPRRRPDSPGSRRYNGRHSTANNAYVS